MSKLKLKTSSVALGSLGLVLLAFTFLLLLSEDRVFERFFGSLPVIPTVVCVYAVAAILLLRFDADKSMRLFQPAQFRAGFIDALAASTIFACIIVVVDQQFPFPADINVHFSESLLFYPVMALVAITIFQLMPFSLLLAVTRALKINAASASWIAIVGASLIEPTFQILFGETQQPLWVIGYTWIHIFLINVALLLLYRKFDFATAYLFRVMYYLYWHVLWGFLRLNIP